MKKHMNRWTALILAMLMVSTLSVGAVESGEPDADVIKNGTGEYTLEVYNGNDTGITIEGDMFHAYQIFTASDSTTYAVTDEFVNFFTGTLTSGDGTGRTYNFSAQLAIINGDDAEAAADALIEYNQLAGLYMESYSNDIYSLATQIRNYLDIYGAYNVDGGVECFAHNAAVATYDAEVATLSGLTTGYYFIMDQESAMTGLGIAASGAFVAISSTSTAITTIKVKDSFPTVDKFIYHNELEQGDVVGDHQIGDTVNFLVMSTLPSNIDEYFQDDPTASYTYTLTDVMSEGLTYDGNAAVYTDNTYQTEIDSKYWDIENSENGFVITVHVELLMADTNQGTLYTHYTATLNENAVVASEYDNNKVTLEYSNSPGDSTQTSTSEDTVFNYTFSLDVMKIDESLDPLAGATFALYNSDGIIKLSFKETDENGVDYYYPNAEEVGEGTIVTSSTGLFQIYGLDDATTYILKEVSAPDGYNAMDDMSFTFTPSYNGTGTMITSLTDGNSNIDTTVENGEVSSSTTIINRKTVLLPSTGGTGTVMFQVGGGVLMLGAATMLLLNKRKKAKESK